MSEDLRQRILEFLRLHRVLTLATSGGAGPWTAALFYAARDDLTLHFISDPETRHCRDIAADPRVAAAIHATDANWETIRGLQIEARAEAIADADRARVESLYLARFPAIAALLASAPSARAQAVAARFAASRFYAIVPQRIRLIDNTRGFGHREELAL